MTIKRPSLDFPADISIEDNPEYTDDLRRALRMGYHNKKGIALASTGSLVEALVEFDLAIKHCPTFGEAWFHRGLTLGQLNRFELAYESFAQAAFLTPLYENAIKRIAALGPGVGRPAEILTPWVGSPPSALRRAFHKLKRWCSSPVLDEGQAVMPEADLRRAFAADPTSAHLADSLGVCLQGQHRTDEAEFFFRYALMLEPWMGRAAAHLCILLESTHRMSQARGIAAAAMNAGAADMRLPGLALWWGIGVAEWTNYTKWLKRAVAAMKIDARASTGHVMSFTDDPEQLYRAARVYANVFEDTFSPIPVTFRKTSDRPITLGYISADFRDHPVARLSAELYELHDRKRFRVFGYGTLKDPHSEVGARIRKAFDKYTDLSAISPRGGAQRIIDDKVDILIDLTGNMLFGPNSIIARRPAPVQVNYLGHPGTTGSSRTDYILVDKIIVPPEQQKWFTEALVYMPECHQVNDRKRAVAAPRTRADYGLPDEGVVYCSFNETKKITPDLFDMWMRILARVPGSVLWLASQKKGTADNMRARVSACGIDVSRVVFAERIPEHGDHMARYLTCDLYLDTLLYNGHTTASDALWAGCPVVTTLGNSYQTRVAASLLQAVGLPELVMPSVKAYEDFAVRVGMDAELRRSLRSRVEANRSTCVLFDTPRFAHHLEWAFEHMWERYVQGRPPAAFDVPALERGAAPLL